MESIIENSIESTDDREFQKIIYKGDIFAEEFTEEYFGDCYCYECMKETLKTTTKFFLCGIYWFRS